MSFHEDFADLKFRMECCDMALIKAGGDPLGVRGPGEIWQDEEGILQFKMFLNSEDYQRLQSFMGRPGITGQLFSDEDFFTLEARQHDVWPWTGRRILPGLRGGLTEGLVYGDFHELVQIRDYPHDAETNFVTLRLKEKLNFPCNQGTETVVRLGGRDRHRTNSFNAAFFDDASYRFEIFHQRITHSSRLRCPRGSLPQQHQSGSWKHFSSSSAGN